MLDRRDLMRHALVLLGAGMAGGAVTSCAPRSSDAYLSAKRLELLDEVAEIMIPQTDTPGARAAGVAGSFDKMLAQWASPDTQRAFDQVLDEIDANARAAHDAAFLDLEPAQRLSVLTAFDAEKLAAPAPSPGFGAAAAESPPYPRFKELIFTAYYMSEPGATQELRLEQVPGPFRGDIPVAEVGRTWAMS